MFYCHFSWGLFIRLLTDTVKKNTLEKPPMERYYIPGLPLKIIGAIFIGLFMHIIIQVGILLFF